LEIKFVKKPQIKHPEKKEKIKIGKIAKQQLVALTQKLTEFSDY